MSYAPFNLESKVAVVIGGTSGIGRAIAHGLAEAGADVVPTSRSLPRVEAAANEIEERGRRTLRIAADVADAGSLEIVRDQTIATLGKVDILVNCAGRTKRAPTIDFSEADWAGILDTNLTGTLRACQVFGSHMLERRYGRIINIASLSSFLAFFEVTAYSASKAAVAALTKSLATEWAPHGVNVNAIAPGIFRTSLNQKLLDETGRGREYLLRTPMKRFGQIEELAGAAVFLASDAASFVTGEILVVDGGFVATGVNQ
jgi:NAD(P)-dependent dehydrogenase (short-subunit alcohol dehydrogenase family)